MSSTSYLGAAKVLKLCCNRAATMLQMSVAARLQHSRSTFAADLEHLGVSAASRSKLTSNYNMVSCSVPNLNTQLPIVMTLDKFEFRQPISRDAGEWTEPAL